LENSIEVGIWDHVERSTSISHELVNSWLELKITNFDIAHSDLPEVRVGDGIPVKISTGILIQIVTSKLNFREVILINEHREHVLFDGTLLI